MQPWIQSFLEGGGGSMLFQPLAGSQSALSAVYITQTVESCFSLFVHCTRLAAALARASAGRSIAARIAIMAITTSSSMSVKPGAADRATCGERNAELPRAE